MQLTITPIPALKDNYIWAIINNQHQALIVDPGEAKPVIEFLQKNKLTLVGILITHHHWDHCDGITAIKKLYDVPVYGPAKEKIPALTHPLHENDMVNIADFPSFRVLDIPGHTLGHIAYYADDMLFCGDTLFAAGCGRIFEGTPAQMYASLQKIDHLPEKTKIYCAHEYTLNNLHFAQLVEPDNIKVTEKLQRVKALREKNLPTLPSLLSEEKETNPFLRSGSVENFARLREWKNNF